MRISSRGCTTTRSPEQTTRAQVRHAEAAPGVSRSGHEGEGELAGLPQIRDADALVHGVHVRHADAQVDAPNTLLVEGIGVAAATALAEGGGEADGPYRAHRLLHNGLRLGMP